jgi:ribosome-associated protein YbcJ (S4-like RNA binding protein)
VSKKFDGKQLAAQKKIELRSASGVQVKSSSSDGKLHHVQVNDEVEGRRGEGAVREG